MARAVGVATLSIAELVEFAISEWVPVAPNDKKPGHPAREGRA
jgi:hypothetical protein